MVWQRDFANCLAERTDTGTEKKRGGIKTASARRLQSQKFFEPFEIQFNIYFPDEVPDIKLINEQRRNLYLVTREALINAMKHSKATIIQLKLDITNNNCCFSVTVNGKGMKNPATDYICVKTASGIKNGTINI